MTRPSDIRIPVGYPNDDPANGAGMVQGDFDDGQIGGDSLRTIAELLQMDTFRLLEPEFQRAYIGLCVAAKVEAGLLLGVGTGWRSEAIQAINHAKWPKQFASVENSLHMRKPPLQVAYAIDSVPYDALDWAHANCGRFGINYLEQIANERHHCQPSVLPESGSKYNLNPELYSAMAAVRVNLPYLGLLSLDDWLRADQPLTATPAPAPGPVPQPPDEEDDDVKIYLAFKKDDRTQLWRGDGVRSHEIDDATQAGLMGRSFTDPRMQRYHNPNTGLPLASWDEVPELTPNQIIADVGKPG